MNKREKIKNGLLKKDDPSADYQRFGVMQSVESRRNPSSPVEFCIKHEYKGFPMYLFRFSSEAEATRIYYEILNLLERHQLGN